MIRWIHRLAGWAAEHLARSASRPAARPGARRRARWGLEGLERREVLSTSAAYPFMVIPATAPAAGQAATVDFQLPAGGFAAGKGHGSILLGLYTQPAPGNVATTSVSGLVGPTGTASPVRGSTQVPMLLKVRAPLGTADAYTAHVANSNNQPVGFGLDGFLAGDVNGDLKVNKADVDRVMTSYGSYAGQARYDAAADVNQDGRVGKLDYLYVMQNLGAHGTIIPTPGAATTTAIAVAPVQATTSAVAPQAASPVVVVPTSANVQPVAYYPAVQYGSAVPSGAYYTAQPTSPVAVAAAPVATVSTPQPTSGTAYTYSYTPNGTTPVYLTPVQAAR